MSIALYKVAKEMKIDGAIRKIGEEVVLKDRVADDLIKKRIVVQGRFLDPEDPDDQKKIDVAEKKHKEKYDAEAEKGKDRGVGKKTRDEKKDADEKAEKEKVDEVVPVPPKPKTTKKAKA